MDPHKPWKIGVNEKRTSLNPLSDTISFNTFTSRSVGCFVQSTCPKMLCVVRTWAFDAVWMIVKSPLFPVPRSVPRPRTDLRVFSVARSELLYTGEIEERDQHE